MTPTTKDEIAQEKRKLQELKCKKSGLNTAMILPEHNTKESFKQLTILNAEMHKTGERLKRLHRICRDALL